MHKKVIVVFFFSALLTIASPFFFFSYFEVQPSTRNQEVIFGGPFPYLSQAMELPSGKEEYPFEAKFQGYKSENTEFLPFPMLFNMISYFLLLFSLWNIFNVFFKKKHIK